MHPEEVVEMSLCGVKPALLGPAEWVPPADRDRIVFSGMLYF
jgi:hypothetical protein